MSIAADLIAEARAPVVTVRRPVEPAPWREYLPPRCQCEGRRRIQCQNPAEKGRRVCTHHRKYLERRARGY